jgi:outer membrane protein TolC
VDPQGLRPLPPVLDAPVLEQRLMASSPFLAGQTAQIEAAEKNRQLVAKNRYPDLTLGISPIQRGNSIDSWDAMLEIKIPLHQGNRSADNKQASALLAAAQDRQQAIINQVLGAFRESFDALGNTRAQISLLQNNLLPQTELTYESALIGYQTGKVDFPTLMDAQRQIKKVRLDLLKAQVEQDNRLTEIERLLGEEL